VRGGSSANPQFSEPIANHALQPKAAKQLPFRQHFAREAVKATTQSEECRRNAFNYPETCPPLSWENPTRFRDWCKSNRLRTEKSIATITHPNKLQQDFM